MSSRPILYLGDSTLSGAAGYLAGLMSLWRFDFDYVPSEQPLAESLVSSPRKLVIVSDYPSKHFARPLQEKVVAQVKGGAGLLMLGGWESYCGLGGDWANTPIGDALPVTIETSDDRINCPQPALLQRVVADHEITGSLPWIEEPPTVGGFNRFTPKTDATSVLDVQRFSAQWHGESMQFLPTERHPMLVVGSHGSGRTAALATDLAPHWVGGFVDWGSVRVNAQAPGSWQIEVGAFYAAFIRNLLVWTGRL